MIVKGTKVIGLDIYTVADGKQIGKVNDIVYDPHENKVLALITDEGGWFSDAELIMMSDVHNIGDKAVLVEKEDNVKKASDVPQKVNSIAKSDNDLTSNKIITEDGQNLGKITDIYFDTITGEVIEFEVSQGALLDAGSGKKTVKISDIITIGEDATIVSGYTDRKFDKQSEGRGLKGALNQAKQTAQESGKKIQDKYQEVKEDPHTQQMVQKAKDKTEEVSEASKAKMAEMKEKAEETKDSPETKEMMEKGKKKVSKAKKATKRMASDAKKQVKKKQTAKRKPSKTVVIEEIDESLVAGPRDSSPSESAQYGVLGGKVTRTRKEEKKKPSKK